MYHYVARSVPGRSLFRSWSEGLHLWSALARAGPGLHALVVMPDHFHLLVDRPVALGGTLSAHARRVNAAAGRSGTLWRPSPEVVRVSGQKKIRRSVRYVHLNPCRAGLVHDPLAWPLCSHLDALGLVDRPVCAVRTEREAFHAYVSSDPTCAVMGSELPPAQYGEISLQRLERSVSTVCRVPLQTVCGGRSAARSLFVQAARAQGTSAQLISEYSGLHRATVFRTSQVHDARVERVRRLAGDSRIAGLDDLALSQRIAQSRYRRWR